MTTITEKYLHKVLPSLDHAEKGMKGTYGKSAYVIPCPFCSRLQTKERKQKKKCAILMPHPESFTYVFSCRRCGDASIFAEFLKKYDERLFNKYQMERYQSGTTGKGHNLAKPKFHTNKPKFE